MAYISHAYLYIGGFMVIYSCTLSYSFHWNKSRVFQNVSLRDIASLRLINLSKNALAFGQSIYEAVLWPFGSQNNCFTLLLINPVSNILVVVHSVKFNLHSRWYHNANFWLSKWDKNSKWHGQPLKKCTDVRFVAF